MVFYLYKDKYFFVYHKIAHLNKDLNFSLQIRSDKF